MLKHLTDVKNIARAAAQVGAPLPERITQALAHLEDITRNAPAAPRPGLMAAELSHLIGDPMAMEKGLKVAATSLASADAAGKIHAHLAEACGARVRAMMGAKSEQVAAAFGAALAGDLATLSATAVRLPVWFREDQAANLDPDSFKAWSDARDAYVRIHTASTALAPLYSAALDQDAAAQFPLAAATALRFAAPPSEFTSAKDAYAFREALSGRAERVQGLAGQGSTFVDGLFVPTALAHVGATFQWATPAQVTERADVAIAGMTAFEQVPGDSGTAHSFA